MTSKTYKHLYAKYRLRDLYQVVYTRFYKKRKMYSFYAGRPVLSINEGNNRLMQMIETGKPFLAMRHGGNELSLVMDSMVKRNLKQSTLDREMIYSGFFPPEKKYGYRFGELMIELSPLVDMAALYYSTGEEFMLSEFSPKAQLVHNRAIEPWYTLDNPWSKALCGKRVLVISPFTNTIESQYKKRELLFPGSDILPDFNLHLLKSVQTIAGQKDDRFADWFEALDYMVNEALKDDFDIAIIGCGAYGFPLAAKLKAAGRQAIHLGGAVQILFGIKGKRWDNHSVISKLYNEHWVRPSTGDTPKNSNKVEGGCYW